MNADLSSLSLSLHFPLSLSLSYTHRDTLSSLQPLVVKLNAESEDSKRNIFLRQIHRDRKHMSGCQALGFGEEENG